MEAAAALTRYAPLTRQPESIREPPGQQQGQQQQQQPQQQPPQPLWSDEEVVQQPQQRTLHQQHHLPEVHVSSEGREGSVPRRLRPPGPGSYGSTDEHSRISQLEDSLTTIHAELSSDISSLKAMLLTKLG